MNGINLQTYFAHIYAASGLTGKGNTLPPVEMFQQMLSDGGSDIAMKIAGVIPSSCVTIPSIGYVYFQKPYKKNLALSVIRDKSVQVRQYGFRISSLDSGETYSFARITKNAQKWITVDVSGQNTVLKYSGFRVEKIDAEEFPETMPVLVKITKNSLGFESSLSPYIYVRAFYISFFNCSVVHSPHVYY